LESEEGYFNSGVVETEFSFFVRSRFLRGDFVSVSRKAERIFSSKNDLTSTIYEHIIVRELDSNNI